MKTTSYTTLIVYTNLPGFWLVSTCCKDFVSKQ